MAAFNPYHKWLGIPPADQPANHYRLLGLNLFESDPDVIDVATEQRVVYLRGCATGEHIAASQKLLNEVAAARLCLLNSEKKRKYDADLRKALERASASRPHDPSATPTAMPWEDQSAETLHHAEIESPRPEVRTARSTSVRVPAGKAWVKVAIVIGMGTVLVAAVVLMLRRNDAGTAKRAESLADAKSSDRPNESTAIGTEQAARGSTKSATAKTSRNQAGSKAELPSASDTSNNKSRPTPQEFARNDAGTAKRSDDQTVKVWGAPTGQKSLTLKGHTDRVWSVAFSPDGQRLASASGDQTVKVWDATTGQESLTLKGHTETVTSVAFSPDGQRLASASWDQTVKVWEARPAGPQVSTNRE